MPAGVAARGLQRESLSRTKPVHPSGAPACTLRIEVALRRWTNGEAILLLPTLDGLAILEIRASSSELRYPLDIDHKRHDA